MINIRAAEEPSLHTSDVTYPCSSPRKQLHRNASFTTLCRAQGIRQSMQRVGSCFDNRAAESFFSTLEHKVLSRHHSATKAEARDVIGAWCFEIYNTHRRHSTADMQPRTSTGPDTLTTNPPQHNETLHDFGGNPFPGLLQRVHWELQCDAARLSDALTPSLGQFEVMPVAGRQLNACLGDVDDRFAGMCRARYSAA